MLYMVSLEDRNKLRREICEKYTNELQEMKKKNLKNYPELKGKINLRRETVHNIMFFSRYTFKDDDEEYERIGKFYRGIFRFVEEDGCFTE